LDDAGDSATYLSRDLELSHSLLGVIVILVSMWEKRVTKREAIAAYSHGRPCRKSGSVPEEAFRNHYQLFR
jgi:hypothetical protein